MQSSRNQKQPTQQSVYVNADCLQNCGPIQQAAEATGQRIITGLKIRRVVTGQGRWGAWREEARWIGRLAGGRDQNFFFFNFLTAFLGNNTSWLDSFGPLGHKRKHALQRHFRGREGNRLSQRTVIIAADKMAARRLIFLLAAFLPPTHVNAFLQLPQSPHPGIVYSESPPSLPITRDPSLRRTINPRQNSVRKSGAESGGHARSVSFSLVGTGADAEHNNFTTHERNARRLSDARSIRGASLAIPNSIGESRKASTSTVVAASAVPVPHFSSISVQTPTGTSPGQRPSSGGSMASQALTHTLIRSESNTTTSGSGGRWGSVVSGFWSNRRDSSTDDSEILASSQDGVGEILAFTQCPNQPPYGKLNQMVDEAVVVDLEGSKKSNGNSNGTPSHSPRKPLSLEDCLRRRPQQEGTSAARSIPQKPRAERIPLKLSINEDEGYIDIQMPPNHSFTSSLASSFASSRMVDHANGSFHEHFSPYGMPSTPDSPRAKSDPTIDVAGWLKAYHPDFALQAVRPYESLTDEIKQSMRAEVSHGFTSDLDVDPSHNKWRDVCTTLIADTTTFSIHRLRLRRRRILEPKSPGSTKPSSADPYPAEFEEQFLSEQVMDMDATLIDAVERVLAQSGRSSRVPSRAPSPSHSRAESVHNGVSSTRNVPMSSNTTSLDRPALEIPHGECRKMVLGALAEVVRSVCAEQTNEQSPDESGRRLKGMPDSTLREGVRRWLAGVEDGF